MKEFDSSNESWTLNTKQLQHFLEADSKDVANPQRTIFLTVVGPAMYALLLNQFLLAMPNTKILAKLIEVLNSHFYPVPSTIVE